MATIRYFLDTEFNGFGGELLSLALVREDGESCYIVYKPPKKIKPWVRENVIPILWSIPSPMPGMAHGYKGGVTQEEGAGILAHYFSGYGGKDPHWKPHVPQIIADWPDDVAYFCKALMVGPGQMVNVPHFMTQMIRAQAYPSTLKGAIQHNSYWDAKALWWLYKERGLI